MEKKKQIVFLEPWPHIMVYKMARLLKEKGYSTISIRILENNPESDKFYKDAFDEIISFNLSFFKLNIKNFFPIIFSIIKKMKIIFNTIMLIKRLKPYVIFTRATPNWPCALTIKLFKKFPVIYFPFDIRSVKGTSKEIVKKVHKIPQFELKAEKYCFEKSKGVLCSDDIRVLDYLSDEVFGKNFEIKIPKLNFYPYCSQEFIVPLNKNKLSKKNKEIHTVYIGSVGSMSMKEDNYLFKSFIEMVNQKIHVHIYAAMNTASKTNFIDESTDSGKELLKSKYFHLHQPLGPKEIIKEISKYDYGLILASEPPKGDLLEKIGGFSVGNKTASYFEAGIPCIYDNRYVFVDELMKKYDMPIGVTKMEDITRLRERLKKIDYKKIEENIVGARKDYLMEKNFPRLEKFMQKIIKGRYNPDKEKIGEIYEKTRRTNN